MRLPQVHVSRRQHVAHLALDLGRGCQATRRSQGAVKSRTNDTDQRFSPQQGLGRTTQTYFFVAEFSRPFDSRRSTIDGKRQAAKTAEGKGVSVPRPASTLQTAPTRRSWSKSAFPAPSIEGARKNLAAEIPGWDFDGYGRRRREELERRSGQRSKSRPVRSRHAGDVLRDPLPACLAPTLFNDADGSYRGLDHKVHGPEGFPESTRTFSLWDTFRAEHPLLTIVQPQRVDDLVGTMLAHYRQFDQHALPVWPLGGQRNLVHDRQPRHPGDRRGLRQGLPRLRRGGRLPGDARHASCRIATSCDEYRKQGYVPQRPTATSRSRGRWNTPTTTGAWRAWPRLLGQDRRRRAVCQARPITGICSIRPTGFMRGKLADGKWRSPFNPRNCSGTITPRPRPGNYTWFVPQDVPG